MKKYLIIILFILFIFPLNTFAIYNSNTQYNITIPNYDDYFDDFTCGSENVKDFLHNFIDNFNSNNKHLLIFPITSNNSITISIIAYGYNDTQYNRFYLYTINSNNGPKIRTGYLFNLSNTSSYSRQYVLNLSTCDSNITTSSSWVAFKNFLDNDIYSSNITDNVGSYTTISNDFLYNKDYSTSFSNNSSYDIELNDIFYKSFVWPYYSDRSLQYKANVDGTYSNPDFYLKKFYITNNDTTYNYLDNDIPTFYDIKDNFSDNTTYYDNFNPLENVIYSNFSSNDYSSVKFTLTMNNSIELYSYINNFDILTSCYGRVNHNNNYYTYNRIDCSYSNEVDDISNNRFKWTFSDLIFSDSNGNIITDFSSYDKLFSIVSFSIKDRDIPYYSTELEINYNKGDLLYTSYKGQIYDSFDNLQPLFKFYLSSNSSYSYDVYSRAVGLSTFTNTYIYWTQYNSTNLTPTTIQGNISTEFSKMSVSNSINSSIMVFQDHIDNIYSKIDFIFYDNLVISYSGTSFNNFYYIDSNGNITNSNINVDFDYNHFSNSYNISYYVDKVNSFINGLSEDSTQISTLTQQFYDDSPEILQAFILVIFIISNIYFVYVLMRK